MSTRNRRTHQRKSLQAKGWIAAGTGEDWSLLSTTDISTGGFSFVSQEHVGVDAVRRFRLELPNDGGLMHVDGRITYCAALVDTLGYRVGVQAVRVDVIDIASVLVRPSTTQPDERLDLVLTRTIDVPRELVWACWTVPEHLKKWFTPAPWKTVDCEIDLRPGGNFHTVMQGPEGQQVINAGCYLEIVENEKLVWTNALLPGFRPATEVVGVDDCTAFKFTAVITLEAEGNATRYTAIVLHRDEAGRASHEAMGFHAGWNAALDQLIAVAKTM